MKGPTRRRTTRTSVNPNPRKNFGRRPANSVQQIKAARFGIDCLSNPGTCSNFITVPTGNSRKPPKMVQTVARPIGRVEYKYIATAGQDRSAAYAIQFG